MKRISLNNTILVGTTLLLATACSPTGWSNNDDPQNGTKLVTNVIYGSDGRLDLYQVTDDRLKILADSTVALIKTSDLQSNGQSVSIIGRNYGTDMNLCSTEKFREQDTAAFCSGSLVGPDLVLTAGHCIESLTDCQSTSLVFGFAVKSASVLPKSVNAGEVYRCKEVIKTHRVDNGADFAIIRLDRAVVGHRVLGVRPVGDVDASASLVVIGHPVGLPTKITTGGTVRALASEGFFSANLDTYGGNSGSGVFNLATGLIEGVLVRGEQDFEQRGGCLISKVCTEGSCRGEDVTKISSVRPFLPSSGPITPPPVDPPPPPVNAPETFTSNAKVSIPDNNAQGISSSLKVTSAPAGRKVLVSVNIQHAYIGDLVVKLTASDGKSVILHQRAGGSARNLTKSYEVTSSLGSVATTGSYKLTVQDLASRDVGSLISWSVQFK